MDKDLRIRELEAHVKELQEKVGAWKRLAKDKKAKPRFYSTGHRNGLKYIVYLVSDIPADLPIEEVLEELQKDFFPTYLIDGYIYEKCDYSHYNNAWMVQIAKPYHFQT